MRGLKGKAAIVTGSADGIGRGIARRLASEGVRVLLADVDEARGGATCAEIAGNGGKATFLVTDVTQQVAVEAMVERCRTEFGSIDILVNNAWGGGRIARVEQKDQAEFERSLAMGFYAAVWAMRAAYPTMRDQRWGRVINLCSLNGVNAHMGSADYNAAKEALRGYTRTAAREWAPLGITANIICPAAWSAASLRVAAENPELKPMMDGSNPMGRLGDPLEDIAPVAAFLASDEARYMTGCTLFVDGGSHINGAPWAPDLGPH